MHRHQQRTLKYYDFESDFEYQLQEREALISRTAMAYNRTATEEYFNCMFDEGDEANSGPKSSDENIALTSSVRNFMSFFQGQLATIADEYIPKQLAFDAPPPPPPPSIAAAGEPGASPPSASPAALQDCQAAVADEEQRASPRGDEQQQQQLLQKQQQEAAQLAHVAAVVDAAVAAAAAVGGKDNPFLHAQFTRNLKQRILNVIKERLTHCTLRQQVEIMDGISAPLERDPLKVLELVGFKAILCDDEFNIPKAAKDVDDETKKRNERKLQEMAEEFCLMDLSVDVIRACDKNTKVRKRLYEL